MSALPSTNRRIYLHVYPITILFYLYFISFYISFYILFCFIYLFNSGLAPACPPRSLHWAGINASECKLDIYAPRNPPPAMYAYICTRRPPAKRGAE